MIILIIVVNNLLAKNEIKMVVYELILNKCLIFCNQHFFSLLLSLSCVIVRAVFDLVALIGLLKY